MKPPACRSLRSAGARPIHSATSPLSGSRGNGHQPSGAPPELWPPPARCRARALRQAVALIAVAAVIGVGAAGRVLASLVEDKPTTNADAYDFYLRGREYEQAGRIAVADTLYQRALALDTGFALARARLALLHLSVTNRPDVARIEQAGQDLGGPGELEVAEVVLQVLIEPDRCGGRGDGRRHAGSPPWGPSP